MLIIKKAIIKPDPLYPIEFVDQYCSKWGIKILGFLYYHLENSTKYLCDLTRLFDYHPYTIEKTYISIPHKPPNIPLMIFMAYSIELNTDRITLYFCRHLDNTITLPLTDDILKTVQKRSNWKKSPYELEIDLTGGDIKTLN